jgi:hypothetical protein
LVQAILRIFQTFFPANMQSITFAGWLTGLKVCTFAVGWILFLGGIHSFDNWSNLSGIFLVNSPIVMLAFKLRHVATSSARCTSWGCKCLPASFLADKQ